MKPPRPDVDDPTQMVQLLDGCQEQDLEVSSGFIFEAIALSKFHLELRSTFDFQIEPQII